MREMIKMVVVLLILASFSGGLLASIRNNTKERIEYQELTFVKGPAIRAILEGSSNDPIVDRFKIAHGDTEHSFFVGVFDGEAKTVALESTGGGFGGDIGVMVGVNVQDDKIIGVGVTTHSETPGIGSKAKTDPGFVSQFNDLPLTGTFAVKTAGGQIDAMSGATVTSQGVSVGVTGAAEIYEALKPQIVEQLNSFSK